MSSRSKKPSSWFARLGSAFGGPRRGRSAGPKRRGLRIESLETRSLLSATMAPTISGTVYEDPTGAGIISNDIPLSNVTLNLFRDGGDGVFEGKAAGSDDTLVSTATSNANGQYSFSNLTAGTYFVQEIPVPGLTISTANSVQTVVINSSDLQGATGTTIDSFSSTSQYVGASYHGAKTETSSASATEAIGGHRNLYLQLTTAGGSVSLGADSDFPGLLDYGAGAASNGTFQVNWDGNNGNASVINSTGLGGLDITSQGASTGIELNAAADHSGGSITLKVYTDANDWSMANIPITNTGDGSLDNGDSQFVAFSSFTVGAGSGANFSDVGAMQMSINGGNAIDGQVGPIQAVGPMVLNKNFVNLEEADLSVVKTATPNPVIAGNQLTYTFTTLNSGPSGATGVTVSDTLPSTVQYVSGTSSQGTVSDSNGVVTLQLGSLGSGASATTSVVVTVNSSATGIITNTATVTGNQFDPNLSNNTSTVTTQVNQPIKQQSFTDLKIVKTAQPNPVMVGNALEYTLTITNQSLVTATTVRVVDTLPTGFNYSWAVGQNSVIVSGNTLTFSLGTLAAQGTDTIYIGGVVTSAAAATITNTATVSADQPESNPADEISTVVTDVERPFTPTPTKYRYLGR